MKSNLSRNAGVLLSLASCLVLTASAQETVTVVDPVNPAESLERPSYWPWTVTLDAGTTGFGGSLSWRFADHFGARAGFDYFEYSDSGLAIKNLSYDAKIRLMSEPLTFDIYPWKKHSFHISVGVQFNQNRLTGTARDTGTVIPPEQLGQLDLKIEQELVNPYLSIGGNFLYFDHAHRWALGGELGVAYAGEPDVSLTRSGPAAPLLDAATRREESRVQDYANQYKWWPVAKLTVSYAF